MKKMLIFTASTGGGHNAVAGTLREIFSPTYEVKVIDALKETNKILDTVVSDGYKVLATNTPKLYGELYKIANLKKMNDSVSNTLIYLIRGKLYKRIMSMDPDLIVGTHPFMVDLVCSMKRVYGLSIPFISFVTDFQAHQSYINPLVDAYVVGSEYTKKTLIKKKVNPEIIYPYGIPIKMEFYQKKATKQKDKNRFTILLMGGSMGVSGIKSVLKKLVKNTHPLRIIVICGSNQEMKWQLEKKYGGYQEGPIRIEILGFSKEVCAYMEISDVIITKPGGITVSESIAKQLPIIIPYMIPGQESENKEFLVEEGLAKYVGSIGKINEQIDEMIDNPTVIEEMKKGMQRLYETYSLSKVVELGDGLVQKYETMHQLHMPKEKADILILSARFGMGHKSVAQSIMDEMKNISPSVVVQEDDLIEWIVPDFQHEIYKGYELLVNKGSAIYNYFYRHNKKTTKGIDVLFMKSIIKDVKEMLEEVDPQFIISTFPLSSRIISQYKEKYHSDIPLITCITDIVDQWEWLHPLTDMYMVATKEVKEGLVEKGIDPGKIKVTGIPVRRAFHLTREELCPAGKKLLVMGGGFGMLPCQEAFYEGLDQLKDIETTVITGSNYELYLKLYGEYENIKLYAFTDQIADIMKGANLLLGKAGGVTLFEAINAELPMVVFAPVLEQEKYNAKFIERNRIGKVFWDMPKDLIGMVREILEDEKELTQMTLNMRKLKQDYDQNALIDMLKKYMSNGEEAL